MPALLGHDEDDPPLLVLEDLSSARWPPPWDPDLIAAVRGSLELLWSTAPPDWVRPIEEETRDLS